MQKLRLKQVQKLKQEQKIKQYQYERMLSNLINSQEQLKQLILYSNDIYDSLLDLSSPNSTNEQLIRVSLSDFTPSSMSKLVFNQHLKQIKLQFDKLPDKQAKIQHFLLIMMKILFVNASRKINVEKQEEILKNVVKEENRKQGIRGLSPMRKSNSPRNKLKQPPNLSTRPKPSKQSSLAPKKPSSSSPIDKYPYYIIALQSMFIQILEPSYSSSTITYHQLQKFIMGQLVHIKNQQSSTQFMIQYEQNKKQDFLLHDNGVKKLIYCKRLEIYVCLDQRQSMIKIYTSELKNKQNFQPNRLKHNRKAPEIVDMFYSDFTNSLGLVLANKSIEIVNFEAFMTKLYEKQFLPFAMNQIVYKFEQPVKKIVFIQMFNKWLIIGSKNQLTLLDCSKYRSKEQQLIITQIKNQKPQLSITNVIQIIPLSTVCIVAGNQLWFYNQTLSKKKFNNYVHEQNVETLKYYQQKNAFYLCGYKQKFLTILKPQRGRQFMQISTLTISRPIVQFQVFSVFNCIVLIDDKNAMRLVNQDTKQVYQIQGYEKIVKEENNGNGGNKGSSGGKGDSDERGKKISILKITRQHFIIYQSYMVSFNLAKVAIQTQIQFQFLPYFYFDQIKEDIWISFNNQIMSVSLIEGEVRLTYSLENSNLEALHYFHIPSPSSPYKPFVIDLQNKIFDLYIKDFQNSSTQNQSKKYKKKLQLKQDLQYCNFDQQLGRCFILSNGNQLYQLKNQMQNAFGTVNITNFINFQVLSVWYVQERKVLMLNCLGSQQMKSPEQVKKLRTLKSIHSSTSQMMMLNNNSASQLSISSSNSGEHFNPSSSNPSSSSNQFILQLPLNQPQQYKTRKYHFQKIKQDDKPEVILKSLYLEDYQVEILLTDENVLYLVDSNREGKVGSNGFGQNIQLNQNNHKKNNFLCIKFYYFLAPKVRQLLKFNQIYLNCIKVKDIKDDNDQNIESIVTFILKKNMRYKTSMYYSLFLTCQQGFFIEIKLNNILNKHFTKSTQIKTVQKPPSIQQLINIDYFKLSSNNQQQVITLSKLNGYKFQNMQQQFHLVKAHTSGSRIEIIKKIQIQFLLTLSIGKDGFLKMWNSLKQCIISLKFPTLRKQLFSINVIQQVRKKRMIKQSKKTIQKIIQKIDNKQQLKQILSTARNHQQMIDPRAGYQAINQNQPIKIDIQNKFIQEIVLQEPNYYETLRNSIDATMNVSKRFSHNSKRYQHNSDKHNQHDQQNANKKITSISLKKQRSFQNLLEQSKFKPHNSISIPSEILKMRRQLHRFQRKDKRNQNQNKSLDVYHQPSSHSSLDYENNKSQLSAIGLRQQMLILPKLKQYKMQSKYGTLYGGNTIATTERNTQRKSTIEPLATSANKQSHNKSASLDDSDQQQYDSFQACVFVKNIRSQKKKANQLDKIDREFFRKQYSLLAKKHLARKKDAVKITTNRIAQIQKQQQDINDMNVNLQTILKDIKRIRYESKYGGDRHIPKVKFTNNSISQSNEQR